MLTPSTSTFIIQCNCGSSISLTWNTNDHHCIFHTLAFVLCSSCEEKSLKSEPSHSADSMTRWSKERIAILDYDWLWLWLNCYVTTLIKCWWQMLWHCSRWQKWVCSESRDAHSSLATGEAAGGRGEGVVWERPPMLGDAIGLRSRGTPNQPPTSSSTFISLIPKQFFQWLRCIQEEKMPFCRINSSYLHGGGGESPLALKKGLIFFSLKICLIRPPRQGGGGRGTPLTDLSDSSWPMTEVSELFLLKWPRKTKHCKKGPGGFVNR